MVAAGALHHIIPRGIERRKIFWDDTDCDSSVNRSGKVLTETRGFLRSLNIYMYLYADLNWKDFLGGNPQSAFDHGG